jgi:predicted  nucleic acid-binding Zn-ribbon protein
MSQSFKLFRLQQIDNELDKIQSRLSEIKTLLADDRKIRIAEFEVEKAHQERNDAVMKLRHAEGEVQSQRSKIEQSEATLYGGKVKNPKELQDLQNEAESLKRYLTTLEDRQLEAMFILDDAEEKYQAAMESQSLTIEESNNQNQELLKEKDLLTQDFNRQESERQAAASNISAGDLALYDSLRPKKSGLAVSRVVEKTCSACGSTLSASTFSSAQNTSKITCCDTCGRLLYVG